ncbi:acyltransferase [Larkinella knui]|uniref:Acyltransferase n=1 Tax=Larkinella knui TaxID=2025310 RepID=A0A3P1CP41_9BACT|nr:acyltransferase [Larkinella knui]RRB14970.1 acyltransferase [Larkinella knui]
MIFCPSKNLPKSFESIQALRAIAALSVALFHFSMKMEDVSIDYPLLHCFKAGFGGVDLFFIISGFIITHTNLSKVNRPHQLVPYLKKRFGRIYSVYWLLFLAASAVLLGLNAFAPSLKWLSYSFNPVEVAKALTLFPNHDSVLPVTWTLSYEIYFYVLFGLLIASRYLSIIPIAILIATTLNGLVSLAGQPNLFGFRLHAFLLSPFNLEFCFGVVAYLLTRRYTFKISPVVMGIATGVFLLTGEWVDPSEIWLRIWGFGLPATVILLGLVQREIAGKFYIPSWLLKLGDASYILYLIHIPGIMILTQALMILGFSQYVVVANFLLLGAMAWFSWQLHYYIERPLLHWINYRRSKPLPPPTAQSEPIYFESPLVSTELHTK